MAPPLQVTCLIFPAINHICLVTIIIFEIESIAKKYSYTGDWRC